MATKKICDRCGAEINPADSVTYVDMNKGRFVVGNAVRELCCSCASHLGRWLDGKEKMARANAPCKNCEKRYPDCHSKCEAYKDYKAVASKEQEIICKAHKERNDYYEASPKYRKGKWGGGQR